MKILIWDFNGTIVDDLDLCVEIENIMLKERRIRDHITREEYASHFHFPVIDYYYWLGYTFEDETYEEVSAEFNELYEKGFHTCGLMEGYREKIREAKEKGYRNVILSASKQDDLRSQCMRLGISDDFLEII